MIGKLYTASLQYFDVRTGTQRFKGRPVLIISEARNNDYTVLPVSTISKRENLDGEYDIEINPAQYPKLKLKKQCFIRAHKQTLVHRASLYQEIADMKAAEPELYALVLKKLEQWNHYILRQARI